MSQHEGMYDCQCNEDENGLQEVANRMYSNDLTHSEFRESKVYIIFSTCFIDRKSSFLQDPKGDLDSGRFIPYVTEKV